MSKTLIKILVINGPNLNLLGTREPAIYGTQSLADIERNLTTIAKQFSINIDFFQSNNEGELINKTQEMASLNYNFAIVNPASYTHTSIAWRDAMIAVKIPFIELHISNIFSREEFRKVSYFSDIAVGVISGLDVQGYELALTFAVKYLLKKD